MQKRSGVKWSLEAAQVWKLPAKNKNKKHHRKKKLLSGDKHCVGNEFSIGVTSNELTHRNITLTAVFLLFSSRHPGSSTKMKPPPLCLVSGLWPIRPPPSPHAAQIAPFWAGAAATVAAVQPPPSLPHLRLQRSPAGSLEDSRCLISASQVQPGVWGGAAVEHMKTS